MLYGFWLRAHARRLCAALSGQKVGSEGERGFREARPRQLSPREVFESHGKEIGCAEDEALDQRAVRAEVVGNSASAYPELEADRRPREARGEVVEREVALGELFGEVGTGEGTIRNGLGDAFSGEAVDPRGFADQHHPPSGIRSVTLETALGEPLDAVAADIEAASKQIAGLTHKARQDAGVPA